MTDIQVKADNANRPDATATTKQAQGKGLPIRTVAVLAIVLVVIFAIVALFVVEKTLATNGEVERASQDYITCSLAARDLQAASDYLTSQSRLYIVTGESKYLEAYLEEYYVTDRRGAAVETLRGIAGNSAAVRDLEGALSESNQLAETEFLAMCLVASTTGAVNIPSALANSDPNGAYATFTDEEKRQLAMSLEFGDEYQQTKTRISDGVQSCLDDLLDGLQEQNEQSDALMRDQLNAMRVITILMLAVVVLVALATMLLVVKPLASYTARIKRNETLHPSGGAELRYVADAYNTIYDEGHRKTAILKRAAKRDPLTGLLNRGAYDALTSEHEEDIAVVLIDIDHFKSVNDEYGHEVGDAVLRKVADIISGSFRLTDFPCRIGGDEFAVIMTDVRPEMKDAISTKLDSIMKTLRDANDDGLPRVTLSIGVAFSGWHPDEESLFRAADRALYAVKARARNGYAFYGEDQPVSGPALD